MELDNAYDNVAHVPGAPSYPPRWSELAEAFRAQLTKAGRAALSLPYGDSARQAFDLFHPVGPSEGTVIFVHGGYWRRFDRSHWSHLAQGALEQGHAVAIPSYDLCPQVSIAEITEQITCATEKVAALTKGPLRLTGHSAGGHLVARLSESGRLSTATTRRIMRIMPISPVSDLRPLLHTSMNTVFQLNPDSAAAESPVLMTVRLDCPVSVWVGAKELPAFLDQARWLSEAWSCRLNIAQNMHHFDIIDALADPKSSMVLDLLT